MYTAIQKFGASNLFIIDFCIITFIQPVRAKLIKSDSKDFYFE